MVLKTKSASPTKKASKRLPQTMAELLTQTQYQLHGWKRGDEIEATIVEKTKRAIYLDIGGKTDGLIADREMKAIRDFAKKLEVGDKVKAIVTQSENDRGQTLLSLKKAAADNIWAEFEEKLKTEETIKVKGKEVNRGGLVVEAKGLQGFIPSSQFSSKLSDKINELMGKDLAVKVIEVNRQTNRLIFSEKEVSEAGLLKVQQQMLAEIKPGTTFKSEVARVMPFGLFVAVKPLKATKNSPVVLEGLVHISEISWEKVDDPGKFFKHGDKIKVKVLAIDEKSGKLNLSIKQLTADPWERIEKKHKVDGKVKGEVVRLAPFGAFVKIEPGVEGLIHISKIPVEKQVNVGDKVDCYIESIDVEHRRISLGLVLKEKPIGYK